MQFAYELMLDAERFKVWSQNLGHDSCLTTFSSYGEIMPTRQAEIIRGLDAARGEMPAGTMESEILRRIADHGATAHRHLDLEVLAAARMSRLGG